MYNPVNLTCETRSFKLLNIWIQTLCHSKQIVYALVQQPICTQHLHRDTALNTPVYASDAQAKTATD